MLDVDIRSWSPLGGLTLTMSERGSGFISHKNREMSILTVTKRQSEVNTSSTSHREFQRRKDKTQGYNIKQKNTTG